MSRYATCQPPRLYLRYRSRRKMPLRHALAAMLVRRAGAGYCSMLPLMPPMIRTATISYRYYCAARHTLGDTCLLARATPPRGRAVYRRRLPARPAKSAVGGYGGGGVGVGPETIAAAPPKAIPESLRVALVFKYTSCATDTVIRYSPRYLPPRHDCAMRLPACHSGFFTFSATSLRRSIRRLLWCVV